MFGVGNNTEAKEEVSLNANWFFSIKNNCLNIG